jgi:hypothetical protein
MGLKPEKTIFFIAFSNSPLKLLEPFNYKFWILESPELFFINIGD